MREHVLFEAPHPIDVRATVDVDTPESWRAALPGQDKVAVLQLCDGKGSAMPGWCTAAGALQGPEIEAMCGGINTKQPTHAGIWRQGNLLHFGFEPSPSEYNPTGQKLLLNGIAYIARFTTDRPIVRERTFVDPAGAGPSAYWLDHMLTSPKAEAKDLAELFAPPWQERLAGRDLAAARAFVAERLSALQVEGGRFTFDEGALGLGVDVRKPGALRNLVGQLRTEQLAVEPPGASNRQRALLLLSRLLPDGPGADTTPSNWSNWLAVREAALCFDPHALVWRLDPLAHWRSVNSDALRGPARADGDGRRDPAAVELAAKIGAHHGGARALDDLRTFTCRFGAIRCLWDRSAGIFRLENSGTVPLGNLATPWSVAIFDTAADIDLLRGGGPEPRPFVSGRGYFRELQERLFLPLLLLSPGTSLRLLPDDAEGHRCLEVRLAGRCADLRKTHVLHADGESGALLAVDVLPQQGARATTWTIAGTIALGPLQLPGKFVRNTQKAYEVEYVEAAWNPPVPAGAGTSKEFLLGGK